MRHTLLKGVREGGRGGVGLGEGHGPALARNVLEAESLKHHFLILTPILHKSAQGIFIDKNLKSSGVSITILK